MKINNISIYQQWTIWKIKTVNPFIIATNKILRNKLTKEMKDGQVQWLIPIILAFWESKVSGFLEARSSRPAWATWRNPSIQKNTKISQLWWCAPVVPATQEAEVRGSPEPRSSRPWSCHCTPAWVTEWDLASEKKKEMSDPYSENYKTLMQ